MPRLTPLQWTTLRWADMLDGLQKWPTPGFQKVCGRVVREIWDQWCMPSGLESSTWRVCTEQVQALRRYGLLCYYQGRVVLTVHGKLALDAKA